MSCRSPHVLVSGLTALVALALAGPACSSDEDGPPPRMAVDEDDVFCDPVDELADDEAEATPSAEPLTQWVDPFIGTSGFGFSVGSAYPGPQMPFGMVKPGPDTSQKGSSIELAHCAGYYFADDTVEGFSHTRLQGAGIADYGGAALMPKTSIDDAQLGPRKHGSPMVKASEIARPGYYAVTLGDTNIRVELTATERVAVHRYTFAPGDDQVVFVDPAHTLSFGTAPGDAEVTIDAAAREVSGSSRILGSYSERFDGAQFYYVIRFDRAPVESGTYAGGQRTGAETASGVDAGAFLRFDSANATLIAHVGLSYVDVAHARANLDAEQVPFDDARTAAEAAWEARLGAMRIDARSDRDRRIAYSALYRALLMPTLASDVDGSYRGIDGQVHVAEGFRYYTDFSLWDTYRTLHPLVTTLYPDDARNFAASLTRMGQETGLVPRWPLAQGETGGMVGDGGTIALADTWVRGVHGWDARAAYAVLRNQALVPPPAGMRGGREGIGEYVSLGYVPIEARGASAAVTLEYAHADHALGELARALGETADAEMFLERGKSWKNVYDPERHLFSGRHSDGRFNIVEPRAANEDFSEGTAWHYAFMVPHDPEGLAETMGRERLLARAEQLFTRAACDPGLVSFLPHSYYWPANEPVLFSGWIFSAVGDQERTARWVRWTTTTHFTDAPDGLPGNDDGGTMSAFYLFGALGLYPVAGTDRWVLGSPLFPRAVLALPGGPLTIEAPGASKKRRFPRAVTRNGEAIGTVLRQADLANATLGFVLEDEPSPSAKMPGAR
jgi:predicted alpha-1,2-mannosidase